MGVEPWSLVESVRRERAYGATQRAELRDGVDVEVVSSVEYSGIRSTLLREPVDPHHDNMLRGDSTRRNARRG